jgi:type II secretory pathway pseudopilin PulG
VRLRLRNEGGFGLIELLMAIVMLNIGILAIVAAFNAGIVSLNRASRISTGASLADAQMELYRALTYDAIALDPSTIPGSSPYTTDPAYSATQVTTTCSGSPKPNECNASRSVTGPDRKKYRVDTYVVLSTASTNPPTPTNGRPVKIVTVVVRDGNNLTARPYAREASTFDLSTGSVTVNPGS